MTEPPASFRLVAPSFQTRITELDGLRGLAIAFVVIWHYLGLTLPPAGVQLQADT